MSFVTVERDGAVATVTITRPDKLNALNLEVVAELRNCFDQLVRSSETRAAVLTGAGKAFVAGADIAAMSEMSVAVAGSFAEAGHGLGKFLEETPFPIIAAVNGFALGGGCELALACDFIYASEKASFGQPEVKLGVIPGFGGTQRLARRIGMGVARELIYTGATISAQRAFELGLVNAVFAAEDLLPRAVDTAKKIATQGPLAVSAAKRVMLRGEGMSLESANELERIAFAALFDSEDQREGMKAFMAKSQATFKGR